MSNVVNNIDLDKLIRTAEEGKKNPSSLKKSIKLQGHWNFEPNKEYQFKTELAYEKGKQIIEIDSPSFLGGNGNRLGPMGYCIAGITSCFITTLVTIISNQGISLNKLSVNADCEINFAKTFDLSDEPITEGITFQIDIQSDNEDKQLFRHLIKQAEERCPAIYSMNNIIKVNAELK